MASFITIFDQFQLLLFRYEVPVIFSLGIIGNLINIIVFGKSKLRKNVCSWHFICLSFAHLALLIFSCLPRIISAITNYDFARYSLSFCKFRAYATDVSLAFSRNFLCLIAIDRWMVTSTNSGVRRRSSIYLTRQLIVYSLIFWSVFNIHVPIKYEVTRLGCSPPLGTTYELFYSMYNIITSILPMIIMALFSIFAARNLRSDTINKVHPNRGDPVGNSGSTSTNTNNRLRKSKRDIQLIRLSIIQVIVFLFLNLIRGFFPLYSFLMNSRGFLTNNERILALSINSIGNNLLFTYTAITFILYTLLSKKFRKECRITIKKFIRFGNAHAGVRFLHN